MDLHRDFVTLTKTEMSDGSLILLMKVAFDALFCFLCSGFWLILPGCNNPAVNKLNISTNLVPHLKIEYLYTLLSISYLPSYAPISAGIMTRNRQISMDRGLSYVLIHAGVSAPYAQSVFQIGSVSLRIVTGDIWRARIHLDSMWKINFSFNNSIDSQ